MNLEKENMGGWDLFLYILSFRCLRYMNIDIRVELWEI